MVVDYKTKTEDLYRAMQELPEDDARQIDLRNSVIELNIKLVSHVLKKYRPYTDDDFQNGCLGLIQAADNYQISRGVPFSSFACFCIERSIQLAYKQRQRSIEEQVEPDKWLRLDGFTTLGNGDKIENSDLIWDERAQVELDRFIEVNQLEYLCTTIIHPSIAEVADRGKHMPRKVDIEQWKQLEFVYIMELVFTDSQKKRFNLTQLAREVGLSIQNVRMRHERVMEVIFQRMWDYMTLSYGEMLSRLRGTKTIPDKLLCLDPGKTTGWALFEKGVLTASGQLEDCYDDVNVNVIPLVRLVEDIKPDFILYEDYKVYSNKLSSHAYNPVFTVRLLGVIETHAQVHNIPTHKQMATTAKNFVTNDKLKQWGMYQRGQKHARDAVRHGCYFLLFHNRGEDIV